MLPDLSGAREIGRRAHALQKGPWTSQLPWPFSLSYLGLRESQGTQRIARALHLKHKRLRSFRASFYSAKSRHLILQGVVPVRRLAGVCIAGGPLHRFGFCDVDIVGRRELQRILPIRNLVVVK